MGCHIVGDISAAHGDLSISVSVNAAASASVSAALTVVIPSACGTVGRVSADHTTGNRNLCDIGSVNTAAVMGSIARQNSAGQVQRTTAGFDRAAEAGVVCLAGRLGEPADIAAAEIGGTAALENGTTGAAADHTALNIQRSACYHEHRLGATHDSTFGGHCMLLQRLLRGAGGAVGNVGCCDIVSQRTVGQACLISSQAVGNRLYDFHSLLTIRDGQCSVSRDRK